MSKNIKNMFLEFLKKNIKLFTSMRLMQTSGFMFTASNT